MKNYTLSGIGLFLCSGLLFAASLQVINISTEQKEISERRMIDNGATCMVHMNEIGHAVRSDPYIDLVVQDVRDPRVALGDATSALIACQGYTIEEFCMGSGCEGEDDNISRVTMTMRLTANKNP